MTVGFALKLELSSLQPIVNADAADMDMLDQVDQWWVSAVRADRTSFDGSSGAASEQEAVHFERKLLDAEEVLHMLGVEQDSEGTDTLHSLRPQEQHGMATARSIAKMRLAT